ncbi:hypothetical protein NPX13_g7295 [Xylaria arbuscula]|uniref:Uncharacterized protein n=1 Tax=Xylaria arbuscula TaxID=114810 RepID=A0A9W8TJL9_9PEZI|nr:hypothetical protein NPX13_g7295 [Xylaria arbuscula]
MASSSAPVNTSREFDPSTDAEYRDVPEDEVYIRNTSIEVYQMTRLDSATGLRLPKPNTCIIEVASRHQRGITGWA